MELALAGPEQIAVFFALAAIAFGGALIYGITGFGSALFTIPLASHIVPLPFALALFSLLDLSLALRVGLSDPKNAVRAEWRRIAPMMVLGSVAGVTLLVRLPRGAAMFALGVFVLVAAASTFARGGSLRTIGLGWAYVAGMASGITSTLFGAGGPPYAIYLSRRPLTKEQYRSTLSICSIVSISLRVIAFLATGLLLSPLPWLWGLAMLPATMAGLWLSSRLFARVSRDLLLRAIGLVLFASGASLVLRAIA